MRIEWQDSYSIGVEEIDRQHKQLINTYNAFFAAYFDGKADQEVVRLLGFLEEYAAVHFADEEALQQRIGFPDYQQHRQQHQELTQKVAELKARIKKEGLSSDLVSSAGLLMTGWLIEHISIMDRAIGEFVREKKG